MAKLLTYDGQVIDPTAYIYICKKTNKKAPYILKAKNKTVKMKAHKTQTRGNKYILHATFASRICC